MEGKKMDREIKRKEVMKYESKNLLLRYFFKTLNKKEGKNEEILYNFFIFVFDI